MKSEAKHLRLSDGRRLAYQEYGDPDGSPALFFHGWIGSRLDFAPNDEMARSLGVRVIALDRPGCGESDFKGDRQLLDWPKDVSEAADNLGFGQFAVCGQNLGDSLRDGPGCGTAGIVGEATDVDSRSRSVARHHLPQFLEEVLDEDEPRTRVKR